MLAHVFGGPGLERRASSRRRSTGPGGKRRFRSRRAADGRSSDELLRRDDRQKAPPGRGFDSGGWTRTSQPSGLTEHGGPPLTVDDDGLPTQFGATQDDPPTMHARCKDAVCKVVSLANAPESDLPETILGDVRRRHEMLAGRPRRLLYRFGHRLTKTRGRGCGDASARRTERSAPRFDRGRTPLSGAAFPYSGPSATDNALPRASALTSPPVCPAFFNGSRSLALKVIVDPTAVGHTRAVWQGERDDGLPRVHTDRGSTL